MRGLPVLIIFLGLLAVPVAVAHPPSTLSNGRPFNSLEAEIAALRAEIEELRSEAAETVRPPMIVDSDDRVLGPLVAAPSEALFGLQEMLLFRNNGKSALLVASRDGLHSSRSVYFRGLSCTGQGYAVTSSILSLPLVFDRTGVFDAGTGRVLAPDPNAQAEVLPMCAETVMRSSGVSLCYLTFACPTRSVVPLEEIGILEFTPPLRIE